MSYDHYEPEQSDTWIDELRMEDDGCPNFPPPVPPDPSQRERKHAMLTLEKRLAIVLAAYATLAIVVFPAAFIVVGIDASPRPWTDCLYLSVTTITGTGYGDIHPTGLARCLACLEMLINVPILAIGLTWAFSSRTD